eukprot:273100_1
MAHIFVELDCRIPQPTTRPTQKPTDTNDQKMIAFEGMPPDVSYGTIASINDNEFIVASQHKTQNDGHIYKFNIHQKEWRKFAEYPKYANISHPKLAFNKDTNKLYLAHEHGLAIYEISTEKWTLHTNSLCKNAQLINANGIFHLIGNRKHFVWNNTKSVFEMLCVFGRGCRIDNSSLVYVPSKNIILSMSNFNIWRYCLMRNKWTLIHEIKVNILPSMPILTSDENFTIFADSRNNILYVLDIRDKNDYILTKTKVCHPRAYCMMARTGNKSKDNCIVIGWIKKLFKLKQFNKLQIPPFDIMQLIFRWYNSEMFHCIQRTKGLKKRKKGHYGMDFKHIFSSRTPIKEAEYVNDPSYPFSHYYIIKQRQIID